jgi:hypothetical protein
LQKKKPVSSSKWRISLFVSDNGKSNLENQHPKPTKENTPKYPVEVAQILALHQQQTRRTHDVLMMYSCHLAEMKLFTPG